MAIGRRSPPTGKRNSPSWSVTPVASRAGYFATPGTGAPPADYHRAPGGGRPPPVSQSRAADSRLRPAHPATPSPWFAPESLFDKSLAKGKGRLRAGATSPPIAANHWWSFPPRAGNLPPGLLE